jgi:hypothetical protein
MVAKRKSMEATGKQGPNREIRTNAEGSRVAWVND